MKRLLTFLASLLISASAFAGPFSGPSPSCTLPSNITVSGGQLDAYCTLQFLSNPTFPGGISTSGTPTVFNGGVAPLGSTAAPQLQLGNIPIGGVALSGLGTNTTDIAGQLWVTDIWVPANRSVTGIAFLQGGTATTDNCLVALYDYNGSLLSTSALAGVVLSGANTFQSQALLAVQNIRGPATYYAAVQCNGTAAGAIQTVSALYTNVRTAVVSGTFGTVPATLTLPTTFTTAQAPIIKLY